MQPILGDQAVVLPGISSALDSSFWPLARLLTLGGQSLSSSRCKASLQFLQGHSNPTHVPPPVLHRNYALYKYTYCCSVFCFIKYTLDIYVYIIIYILGARSTFWVLSLTPTTPSSVKTNVVEQHYSNTSTSSNSRSSSSSGSSSSSSGRSGSR